MEPVRKWEYHTEADYYALPDDVRVELIDGVFYDMAAPTQLHQQLLTQVLGDISNHINKNKGKCIVIPAPFDVKLESTKDNIVQPDISVICDREKLDGKRCNGAPDWVIEIASPGNPAHDYIKKLNLYHRAGVKIYWIIDLTDKSIITYRFDGDIINFDTYTFEDKVQSGLFPTLEIDFKDIMERIS